MGGKGHRHELTLLTALSAARKSSAETIVGPAPVAKSTATSEVETTLKKQRPLWQRALSSQPVALSMTGRSTTMQVRSK